MKETEESKGGGPITDDAAHDQCLLTSADSLEVYEQVVEKCKAFIDTPRDEDGKLVWDIAKSRIESLFEKPFIRFSEYQTGCTETTESFCQLEKEMFNLMKYPNLEFRIFRYKLVAPGVMDYYFRFAIKEEEIVAKGKMYFNEHAMVYKSQVDRKLLKMVSGQHSAVKDEPLTNRQTERQFSSRIYKLPAQMNENLLGDGTPMVPVQERYEMVRIFLVGGECNILIQEPQYNKAIQPLLSFSSLVWNNLTGIWRFPHNILNSLAGFWRFQQNINLTVDQEGNPYADGAYFRFTKQRIFDSSRKITLFDGNHEPVALCCEGYGHSRYDGGSAGFSRTMYTIYGTRPLLDQQYIHEYSDPIFEDVGEKNNGNSVNASNVVAFYPWFRMNLQQTANGRLFFISVLIKDGLMHEVGATTMETERSEAEHQDLSHTSSYSEDDDITSGCCCGRRMNADFEPLYKVIEVAAEAPSETVFSICDYYDSNNTVGVVHVRNIKQKTKRLYSRNKNTNQGKSSSNHIDHRSIQVDVAPGVDPALILCIAACLEMKEL